MQLILLNPNPARQAKPVLAVEPVQDWGISPLGYDRHFIVVRQGERRWFLPVQLTAIEAHWLLPSLEGLDWSLEAGTPADLPKISAIIERAIDDRIAGGGK